MVYKEEILDHAKNPRNFGELPGKTHGSKESNASCGDMVEMYLVIDRGRVKAAGFRGLGCALSTASASMLTEKVKGMSVEAVKKLDEKALEKLVGRVNPGRLECVRLPLKAIKGALVNRVK